MDTWVIVLIVVAVVIVLALLALALSKRSRVAQVKKREQAREHLQEAQLRGAQAEKERAAAEAWLASSAPQARTFVASQLRLRHAPTLEFVPDTVPGQGARIDRLLAELGATPPPDQEASGA